MVRCRRRRSPEPRHVDLDQIGTANVKAFWLAGHSQGGTTSNRLLRTPFFKARVDGWLSLSGGRLGGAPGRASSFGAPPAADAGARGAAAPASAIEKGHTEGIEPESMSLMSSSVTGARCGKLQATAK